MISERAGPFSSETLSQGLDRAVLNVYDAGAGYDERTREG
jgi:hypothetical protein